MIRHVFVILAVSVIGCTKAQTAVDLETDPEVAVTTGVASMSAVINPQTTSAARGVTSCTSVAAQDECDTATKTKKATYTDCPIGASGLTFSGDVTLTYNKAACSMILAGSSVTRTASLTRQGVNGSHITTSTDTHTDYRGTSLGGGAVLSRVTGGYETEILGIHKVKTNSEGSKVFDMSLRTTQPYTLSDISESSITVSSGEMEVIHNLASYVGTFTVSDLVYHQATCCYPTSGSITVAYTGSITGAGSVAFGDCGTVTFTRDGASKELTLPACE